METKQKRKVKFRLWYNSTKTIFSSVLLWIANTSILPILVFLISCDKDPTVLLLSQDFKEYSVFNKNSYWIYINDSTGESDSAYVNYEPSIYYSEVGSWLEETINVPVTSTFLQSYYLRHNCSKAKPNTIDENTGWLELFIKYPNDPGGPYDAMWYNSDLNVDLPQCTCTDENCFYMKSEFIDEMSIRGNKFQNVLHANFHSADTTELNPNSFSHHYYFVKNVGLIKFKESNAKHKSYRSYSISKWEVHQ